MSNIICMPWGGGSALRKLRKYLLKCSKGKLDGESYEIRADLHSSDVDDNFEHDLRLLTLYLFLKSDLERATFFFEELTTGSDFSFDRSIAKLDDSGLWKIATENR